LISLGGQSSLQDLYQKVEREAPERMKQNKNWQAKVRQVLQMSGDFKPVERGVWQLA
jgi:sulfur transfer protein SufE